MHLDLNGSKNPDTFADADQYNYEHDGSLNTISRWEANEELDALLGITLKPMPRFDRRTIIREFPRPLSDAAFTPMLDSYLPAMISGAKVTNNNLRDMQDKVLDVLGPLCTIYESHIPLVPSNTLSRNRIFGIHSKFSQPKLESPKRQNKESSSKLSETNSKPVVTVCKLAKFLGLLSSSIQAEFPAPLHYRYLQHAKNSVLKCQKSHEALVSLDTEALQEVQWWRDNLQSW